MPYYELGDLLLESAQSVLAQTYKNWELIVVDDCSPNHAAEEVLASLHDPRIKIIRHEMNQGNAAGRNTAAKHSQGEIYLSLDSDDLLKPEYIQTTLEAMHREGASAACTDVQIFGIHNYVYKPSIDLGDIIAGHYPHNTFIFKKEVFDAAGGYKNFEAIVDTEFWISVLELSTKFAYVPQPLWSYRKHSKSWSQNYGSISAAYYKVLIAHVDTARKHVPKILEEMIRRAERQIAELDAQDKRQEDYRRLHTEFHELLQKYETLEKQAEKSEQILASFPKLARQFLYVAMKKNKP